MPTTVPDIEARVINKTADILENFTDAIPEVQPILVGCREVCVI